MDETKRTGKPDPRAMRAFFTLRRLRMVTFALAGLLTLGVSVGSAYTLTLLWQTNSEIDHYDQGDLQDLEAEPEDPLTPINVLILGSDTRAILSKEEQAQKGFAEDVGGERSDTIILARFDPQEDQASLLHFPRDLRVEIPGHGTDKINAAFTLGGPNLTIKTIRQLTGIPIHHYVEVNFNSFRSIVQALGGVEICVDQPMIDPLAELHLPEAGCYDMDGDTALAFVRARGVEGDVIPDFARIARQQQFIRAVMNKVFSFGSLTKIPHLVRVAARNVTTDEDIGVTDLIDYGRELRGLAEVDPSGASTVDLRVVPSTPDPADPSFVVAVNPQAERLFRRFRMGRPLGDLGTESALTPPSPAQIATRIIDTGGPATDEAERLLQEAGFIVLDREEAEAKMESAILFARGADAEAQVVAGFFPDLPVRPGKPRLLGDAEVALVVGKDYQGPER